MLWLFLACADEVNETETVEQVEDINEEGEAQVEELDLSDPIDNTKAFVKMRGSLDETEEVVFYWHGYIYNHETAAPTDPVVTSYGAYPIMAFEGYNIARLEKISDTEYQMLSREITVYKNLFGNVIDCFDTFNLGAETPQFVPVVHVKNDPVNFVVGESYYKELGELIVWDMDMFLSYESPLPIEEYPLYSASNTYQSVELFDFYTQRADLEDPTQNSVPVHLSWVRHGQYLPWMQMGQQQGHLVYHAQGYKVMDGWDGLPDELKKWTEDNAPEYKHAPEHTILGPNVTSWRYMKSLLEDDLYPSSCQ